MRLSRLFLIFSLVGLLVVSASAVFAQEKELKTWASVCGGEFQSGPVVELFASDPAAKIYWTTSPNGSFDLGKIYEAPIQIRRSVKLYFFAFKSVEEATLFQICDFRVESGEETSYLRILEVRPAANLIVLKNWSKFPVVLAGWKMTIGENVVDLPIQELAAGAELAVALSNGESFAEITLISPLGRTKDRTLPPSLLQNESWRRTDSADAFSVFAKTVAEKEQL